ncbi:MAG: helix-turn-helix domain-containing protein [Alphaproteobacteria bacterium]
MAVKSIESLRRGLAVYDLLHRQGATSLATLARETGLPKATLLRLLRTLQESGWIARRFNDGRYLPATTARPSFDIRHSLLRSGMAAVQSLSDMTGLPADLVALTDTPSLEVVDSTRRRTPGGVDPLVAGFRPSFLFSSPGRAVLANLPDTERERILTYVQGADSPAIRFELTSGRLAQELDATRRRGYGIRAAGYWPDSSDYGAEPMDISVPIIAGSRVLGAVSLVWPSRDRTSDGVARDHLDAMRAAADEISRAALSSSDRMR